MRAGLSGRRSFILGKFTLARETFWVQKFGSFQLPSSVNKGS